MAKPFVFHKRPPGSGRTARLRKKRAKYLSGLRRISDVFRPLLRGWTRECSISQIFEPVPVHSSGMGIVDATTGRRIEPINLDECHDIPADVYTEVVGGFNLPCNTAQAPKD